MPSGMSAASASSSYSSYGLCTPPTPELELPSDIITRSWTSLSHIMIRSEEETPYAHPPGFRSGMRYGMGSKVNPTTGHYTDFLGIGPGLVGSSLDSDPDLAAMKELKNRFSPATTIYNTPITPPLTPQHPTVAIQVSTQRSEDDEDGCWVECSAENDGHGPPIRGWSPPEGDKYVAVDISFENWNPILLLTAGPALIPIHSPRFPTFPGIFPATQEVEAGLGLNASEMPPSESQQTICIGDDDQTSRAIRRDEAMINTDVRPIGTKFPPMPESSESACIQQSLGDEACVLASQNAQPLPRRPGPACDVQTTQRATGRKRNDQGTFLPSNELLEVSKYRQESERGARKEDVMQLQRKSDDVPKSNSRSTHSKEYDQGLANDRADAATCTVTKPRAPPLAFLPPHLARSITRNAVILQARDNEKAQKKAVEETAHSSICYWPRDRNVSTVAPEKRAALADKCEAPLAPSIQGCSVRMVVGPQSTATTSPIHNSHDALGPVSQGVATLEAAQNVTSCLPTPISVPTTVPYRLGRTASDPGSQQLLRVLAASLAHEFTQRGDGHTEGPVYGPSNALPSNSSEWHAFGPKDWIAAPLLDTSAGNKRSVFEHSEVRPAKKARVH